MIWNRLFAKKKEEVPKASRMEGRRGDGCRGERIACDYLVREGYTVTERNVFTPYGELDIIAQDERHILFIEVKQRNDTAAQSRYGRPALAVNAAKRKHIIASAQFYLHEHRLPLQPRFDVIEILTSPACDGFMQAKITHIKNAFGVDGT